MKGLGNFLPMFLMSLAFVGTGGRSIGAVWMGFFFSLFLCTRDTSSAIHMEATVVEMFVRTYQILNGIMVFGDFLNTTTHVSERIKCGRDSI